MRFLLFVVAFVVGIALTAPLERWLLPMLRGPMAAAGAELHVDSLHFALPAGLRATGVGIETAAGGVDIDSLYVGITRSFQADACDGHASGTFGGDSFAMDWSGVNPSRCLRIGKLELESPLDGSLSASGINFADPRLDAGVNARIDVTASAGVFRGLLPHACRDGSDLPLGEWEFNDLVLHASFAGGHLEVREGHAVTSGVEWQLLAAQLPTGDPKGAVRIDFRARQVDDGPRSRALMGLMPRAAQDGNGWRSYRVTGSMASPRVIGIE